MIQAQSAQSSCADFTTQTHVVSLFRNVTHSSLTYPAQRSCVVSCTSYITTSPPPLGTLSTRAGRSQVQVLCREGL